METHIWDVRAFKDNLHQYPYINDIKDTVIKGGLVAIPTETVYGLGANAKDEAAVKKIYEAKGRPSDNPLIVHVHHRKQLDKFVEHIDERVSKLMDAFWPGPISFILPLKSGYLCETVTGGLSSIAVRMPSHKIGRALLQVIDEPIAAPSANLSGRPSPTTFDHVFHDLNHKIDGIVNGDQSEEGLESTVLDCTQFPFRIARPGSVTKEMIEKVLPESVQDIHFTENEKPIAPGMKYKHYSPDTPLTIIENLNHKIDNNEKWKDTAFIFPESMKSLLPESAQFISLCKNAQDIKTANHNLYSILHSIDRSSDIQRAFIFGFEKKDQSEAIMNRMLKAAGNEVIKGDTL
ncbi:L-threonylcarbamoyladenylate synthase [Staphylococcus caprae]|uniref:L-threonylcarbamoyladenylate synthase n=1 Tax=Staphylococcus caprae TaxID=29380 RepID=UPI000E6817DF|nr:L-threonylcarbamoyladenylate synthase [Staphylococcus caprae]MDK6298816.1 L-threonylcarbamoyladenylate synthase [Staphylococcus caprae]MDK7233173.1 L-threonylcarbamoyladenylate synthase [Staphylococcus caprae]RIM34908.1 threonylcarbamoyl-AMP synthase [Staphylococcus caprae]